MYAQLVEHQWRLHHFILHQRRTMETDSPYVLTAVPTLYFIGFIGSFVLAIVILVTEKKDLDRILKESN